MTDFTLLLIWLGGAACLGVSAYYAPEIITKMKQVFKK